MLTRRRGRYGSGPIEVEAPGRTTRRLEPTGAQYSGQAGRAGPDAVEPSEAMCRRTGAAGSSPAAQSDSRWQRIAPHAVSAEQSSAALSESSTIRNTPRCGPSGGSRPAMCAITPTPGALAVNPLPWNVVSADDSSPGAAYSSRQFACSEIFTVGPAPVGDRLQ